MVKEKKIVGILDWDTAGYFPCWYDYAITQLGYEAGDQEWKRILHGKLDKYKEGADSDECFRNLSRYPNLSKAASDLLERIALESVKLNKGSFFSALVLLP